MRTRFATVCKGAGGSSRCVRMCFWGHELNLEGVVDRDREEEGDVFIRRVEGEKGRGSKSDAGTHLIYGTMIMIDRRRKVIGG